MLNTNTVYIRAKLSHATEKAICLIVAGHEGKYWLPKSQVVNIDEAMEYLTSLPEEESKVEYVDWEVKEWIVQKNGMPTGDDDYEEEIPF